jgi:hypothetical protein
MTMRTIRHGFLASVLAATALLTGSAAAAAVPTTITHQGRLFDNKKAPINATLDVEFAIYDDAAGAVPIWSEIHQITFEDGFFSVQLGAMNPFDG